MTLPTAAAARMRSLLRDSPARGPLLWGLSFVRDLASAPAGVYTLCYHRIPVRDRANFARQLDHLGRAGTFVSADQAHDLIRSGGAAKGRFFLLTFDDGYADQIDVALPILVERSIPAIAFIVTAWLTEPPDSALSRADGYMTPADLVRWRASGMDVGSHTHAHRRLATLNQTSLRDELRLSSDALARILGERPRHFACPWGVPVRDFDPHDTPRLAREEGYVSLFTTTRGAASEAGDAWLMPRHVLEPEWPLYQLDALVGASRLRPKSVRGQSNREQWH